MGWDVRMAVLAIAFAAPGLVSRPALAEEPPAPATAPAPAADSATAGPTTDLVDKKPSNYEFAFVSVAAYQNWTLVDRVLFFGAGGGLGPPLYRYSKLGSNKAGWDPDLDIAYANVYLRVAASRFVDIDVGPKIAIGSALYNVKDPPQSAFSFGGYVDLRVGSPTIKFGPRFEFDHVAYSDYSETGWRITPLLLRIVH